VQRYRADVSEQDLLSALDNAPVGMAVLTPSGMHPAHVIARPTSGAAEAATVPLPGARKTTVAT
jgi:hypothetical protein